MAHKGTRTSKPPADPDLRKETRDWLATRTIPNVREIAKDLENAGEDVHDLLAAIDELEALLKEGPTKTHRPSEAKAEA